jgi:hypothetical protein
LTVFSVLGFGLVGFLTGSRLWTGLSRRTGAGGGCDTRVTTTGGGGVVTTAAGGVAGGGGGGAGGGVTRVAGFWAGSRFALGGASGFGAEDLGGAGSGAGSCASA